MKDIGASFTDSVIAALSRDQEVIDAIVKEPVWDADRRVLIIWLEPKSEENAMEMRERVVGMIRGIRGFNFKAEAQETDVKGKVNFFFKLTVEK